MFFHPMNSKRKSLLPKSRSTKMNFIFWKKKREKNPKKVGKKFLIFFPTITTILPPHTCCAPYIRHILAGSFFWFCIYSGDLFSISHLKHLEVQQKCKIKIERAFYQNQCHFDMIKSIQRNLNYDFSKGKMGEKNCCFIIRKRKMVGNAEKRNQKKRTRNSLKKNYFYTLFGIMLRVLRSNKSKWYVKLGFRIFFLAKYFFHDFANKNFDIYLCINVYAWLEQKSYSKIKNDSLLSDDFFFWERDVIQIRSHFETFSK